MDGKFFNIYNEIGRLRDVTIEKDLSYSQTNDILNQILLIETQVDMLERDLADRRRCVERIIEAREIDQAIFNIKRGHGIPYKHKTLTLAIKALEQMKENKGEWISYHLGAKWICSQCNEKNNSRDNFCPNCGADMRGEKNV